MPAKLKQLLNLKEIGKVHRFDPSLLEKEVKSLTIYDLSLIWPIFQIDPVMGGFTYTEAAEMLGNRAMEYKIYIF